MRAIFVNHCHPDCPHVCGTRAREFANALARQGHHIVLLTETLRRGDEGLDPATLPAALAAHDWSAPFRLAVRPRSAPVLEALRAGRLPSPARAVVVAYQYLRHGGMFTDWRHASQPYWQALADAFRPDVVWGIFGNTDAWAIAQGIARTAHCPWVRDLKDQWTAFIAAPFRIVLSRRFADAAATTALSEANAANAAPWFPAPARVVYSGVPETLIAAPATQRSPGQPYSLVLVGALYDDAAFAVLVNGLRRFADAAAGPVSITYAGTDTAQAAAALKPLAPRVAVEIRGQMPFAEYWSLVTWADANLYVRTAQRGWWHHKIVELLAARRPIVCVPGEIEEADRLVRSVGGRLYGCPDADGVRAALAAIQGMNGDLLPVGADDAGALRALSWNALARDLLKTLEAAVAVRAG